MRLAGKRDGRKEFTGETPDRLVGKAVHLRENITASFSVGDFFVVGPEPLVFFRENFLRAPLFRADEKGNFEILVPIGAKIVVTTPDKATKTIVAQQYNEVKMDPLYSLIEEGNTLAYSKFETTAATSTIYSEDIMKSSAINAQNALYGRGLGLTALQNDGMEYDNNTDFNIRG